MKEKRERNVEIKIRVPGAWARLLATLDVEGSVETVLLRLADHAHQGVYRPGAWERGWLEQAFGQEWQSDLEPGCPFGRKNCESIFVRPVSSRLAKNDDGARKRGGAK